MPRRRKSEGGEWRARIGDGGWAVVEGGEERVALRVELDETNRYRVRELHLLDTGEPVTAERLRAVRVAALEQLLNLPEERAALDKRFARRPSVDLEAAVARFAEVERAPRTVYGATRGLHLEARITTSGSEAPALRAPRQRGYSDEFYERVAEAYRRALRPGGRGHSKPIETIAAEAGVPRSTAARWVKEARRRELLGQAPATGKAGEGVAHRVHVADAVAVNDEQRADRGSGGNRKAGGERAR